MNNFWDYHGWLFILAMFFFPRLTMLFATTVGGGLLYWLGWFFLPRFTVAIIATTLFYENNVVLLIFTWLWALTGEATEKSVAIKK
jgi:uncharacterized membrane protein (DUF106 family)